MVLQKERIKLWIFYNRLKSIAFLSFVSCVLAIGSNSVIFCKFKISVSEILCDFSEKSSLESFELACIFFVMAPDVLHGRVEIECYSCFLIFCFCLALIDVFGYCKRRNQNMVWRFFLYFVGKYIHQ